MKPHLIIIYSLLVFQSLLSSCTKSDWLDEKVNKKLVVPATITELQALIEMGGNTAMALGLAEIASDGHSLTESIWQARSDSERNAYIWSHNSPYENVPDWNYSYSRIFYSNVVLEGIKKIVPNNFNRLEWNNVYGSALFIRAFAFFSLSQMYCKPYSQASAATELGIPLRLESNINIPTVRSSLQETYDQIQTDLLASLQYLPDVPQWKIRPSKAAAYGLLSRMFLSMREYQKAGLYADSCLQINDRLLDYNKDITLSASYPIALHNNEVVFHSTLQNYNSLGNNSFVDKDFYDQYGSKDVRKSAFFRLSGTNVIFRGSYYGGIVQFGGIATNEMYLNRAECYAREGKRSEAISDLNALLSRRYQTGQQPAIAVDISKEFLLDMILKEREKELFMRGLRWIDLRRLNSEPRYQKNITRTIAGKIYTLTPGYTFPIPDDIIQATGIQQN